MADVGKWLRRGLKEPVQSAFAWAMVRGLDARPRTLEEVRAMEPRSIVASRTDRIGDLLVSSVMIAALHRRWPQARLVVIGGPRNLAALEGLPFVERGPPFSREPGAWLALRRWLRAQPFDLAFSLQAESMAGVLVAAWSRAPNRVVTHATKAAPAFNCVAGIEDRHHVTRFCRTAERLGVPCAEPRPVYVVAEAARERVREIIEAWGAGGRRVVGIQIPNRSSRRHVRRAWPADRVRALAAQLVADDCRVVVFGFGAELEEARRVRAAVPGVQLAPPGPLADAAAMLEGLDVFVCGYTGTYHLADAVGTGTVLIGSADYAAYWKALGIRHRHALAASAAEVPVEPVLRAARELLAQRTGA